jgi:predicted RNase H-like HicB family nuclease
MQQMDVNPPAAAAREPLSILGMLEARLAQVDVRIDEAWRQASLSMLVRVR